MTNITFHGKTVCMMNVEASFEAPCTPELLFSIVEDLGNITPWLDLLGGAEPSPADPADTGPAWGATFAIKLGPLTKTKDVRLVRIVHSPQADVVYERHEVPVEGRDVAQIAMWRLTMTVSPTDAGSALHVHVFYGGDALGDMAEGILTKELNKSRPALLKEIKHRVGVS